MRWLADSALFFRDMFRHWVGKMTGLLSIVLGIAPVAFPHFFEGEVGLLHNRWMWWAAAAASFLVAARMAWDEQRKQHLDSLSQLRAAQDQLADRYPRLKGEIALGYLDVGMRYEKDRLLMYGSDCVATFYLRLVNHSDQDCVPFLPPVLNLTINGKNYSGEYVIPAPGTLTARDPQLKGDGRIIDLFQFSIGGLGMGVFQKGLLHAGWIVFNLPDARDHLDGNGNVVGAVTITIKDTLGGVHPVDNPEITFRLNKIGLPW